MIPVIANAFVFNIDLNGAVQAIRDLPVHAYNAIRHAAIVTTGRVIELMATHRHLLFFILSTTYSAISSPSLFMMGVPIGMACGFLVGKTSSYYGTANHFYLSRDLLYEGAIAEGCCGSLNIMGKMIHKLTNNHPFLGQDGVASALLAGTIAGAYTISAVLLTIDVARAYFA